MTTQLLDAKVNLRLDGDLRAALEAVAKAEGRSLSNATRRMVELGLATHQSTMPVPRPATKLMEVERC